MAAMSGCPPTISSCDPNAPLQAISLPGTPVGLLSIVEIATGCVIVLLLIAGVYLLLTRSSAVPLWRRKLAMGTFVFALISAAVAVYAWIAYLPFTQVGLPINASYTEWLAQIGPVRMNDLDALLNSLTCVTGGILLGSLVFVAIIVGQAMRHRVWRNTQ